MPDPNDTPLLDAEGIHKRYGGVHALRGARLAIRPARSTPSWARTARASRRCSRSSRARSSPTAARSRWPASESSFRRPTDALRQGIATVTQETTLAPDLSVAENVFLGRLARRGPLVDWRATAPPRGRRAAPASLDVDPSRPVRRLRPDQQQLVEIARALSIDARVLILDEPTSSLTDDEVAALFRVVRRLRDEGVATIFVSHRLQEVFALADRLTVLRDGRRSGRPATGEIDEPG